MADEPIRSRPYSTAAACEKCVFGRGEHASFCERWIVIRVQPLSPEMERFIEMGFAPLDRSLFPCKQKGRA